MLLTFREAYQCLQQCHVAPSVCTVVLSFSLVFLTLHGYHTHTHTVQSANSSTTAKAVDTVG